MAKNTNPGPGQYAPHKYPYPASRNPPEYSMGKRFKPRTHDGLFTPAPNSYSLPSRIGMPHPDLKKAPGYFLAFRNKQGEVGLQGETTNGSVEIAHP